MENNEQFEASMRRYKEWLSRADEFSDEDFFIEILALPDKLFKRIASHIRTPNPIEEEKGMRCSLLVKELEYLQKTTKHLEKMGLVRCYTRESSGKVWGEMAFNQNVIASRLSQRRDLIEKLKDSAKDRGVRLF